MSVSITCTQKNEMVLVWSEICEECEGGGTVDPGYGGSIGCKECGGLGFLTRMKEIDKSNILAVFSAAGIKEDSDA